MNDGLGCTDSAYNLTTFNAAGRAAILAKKNDTFKIAIISAADYYAEAPDASRFADFQGSAEANSPSFNITYYVIPAAPTNVSATDGTYTNKVTITWTKSSGATDYHVWRDAVDLGAAGDVSTFDDAGASAPTITPGTASASDGSSSSYVTASLSGQSANNGTTHTYKVVASNLAGNSPDSSTNTGYRGVGSLTYQWQRSAADSDASYGDIGGGTTASYNDTGAPSDGSGRYFKCVMNATGASQNTSTSDRGYRMAPPTVTTQSASSVGIATATLNGNITATGGANATVRGFAWGTVSTLSGGDTATTTDTVGQPFSTGAFTGSLTTLTCNTTYYSRAYATNTIGTGLGAISASFTTSPCIPTVTTQSASSIGIATATLNGNITVTGGANATVRGFAWGTVSTLSGGDTATTTESGSFGTGAFSTTTIAFVCNTTYYSRAYATNTTGTGLGAISSSFTTSPCLAPTVTTQAVTSIAPTTATGNGNVTSDNGATITERGVVVSTSSNPTIADDKFTSAGTTGAFTADITGRTAGKLYYVRAYAINSVGTSYGDNVAFTTTVSAGPTSIIATNDGRIRNNDATYTTARNATAGNYTDASFIIGQSSTYYINRSFASFAIPDMATITSASLFLYGNTDGSTVDFGVYILTSTYSNPFVVGDFDLFSGHQASGAYNGTVLNDLWNTSSYSASWNEFVFNADGLSAVLAKKNDTFLMAAISKEDYDNSANTDTEYVWFENSTVAGKEPYLSITYTTTVTAPTVTTQDPTNKLDTSLTANGNITSIGTAAVTTRGFKYGLTQADTWDVHEDGSFGTGAFTASITGLTKGTNYYMRAYATNSVGTVYGSYAALTTNLQSDAVIFRNNVILNNEVILK